MRYLIDGYNLLHALGLLHRDAGPSALRFARQRLLDTIRIAFDAAPPSLLVIFDAAAAPPGVSDTHVYRDIEVRFAVDHDEADDLIEALIREDSVPRQLSVVSDDHRIQQAARRRQCAVLGCDAFLDWLETQGRPRAPAPRVSAKPHDSSAEEAAHWQRAFGSLDDDPAMKELFDPFGFEKDER